MDYFYGDSANLTNGFSLNKPVGSTLEDKLTRKRWTRGLLAFYACLSIGVSQIIASSNSTEQHASLWNGIQFNHGFVPRPIAPMPPIDVP